MFSGEKQKWLRDKVPLNKTQPGGESNNIIDELYNKFSIRNESVVRPVSKEEDRSRTKIATPYKGNKNKWSQK